LADALEAKGINTFIDRNRLEAGKPWEPQLRQAVQGTRHLVALWSSNAKQSDWVQRELYTFDNIAGGGTVQGEQRLIFLNLEAQNLAFQSYQMIEDLKEAQVQPTDIASMPVPVWEKVVTKVVAAIRNANATLPIYVAVLTATHDELDTVDPREWDRLQDDLKLSKAELLTRYKTQRTEWKPFGGGDSILTLLDRLVDDINQAMGEQKFHRELIGEDFWTSDVAAETYRRQLLSNISLVVVDPIALRVVRVLEHLNLLRDCFESDLSTILVLPPFAPFPAIQGWRRLTRYAGGGLFRDFFEPPVPLTKTLANCEVCLHDMEDVKRLLRFMVGKYILKGQPQPKPVYVKVGNTGR
jgi:hypothetical protein